MDWFLYEKNLRHERVNIKIIHPPQEKLRFASLYITYFGWIISDGKQRGMKCMLIIGGCNIANRKCSHGSLIW